MSTDKKRIATYIDEEIRDKFRVIAALKRISMSEYIERNIIEIVKEHEEKYGPIEIDGGGGRTMKSSFQYYIKNRKFKYQAKQISELF